MTHPLVDQLRHYGALKSLSGHSFAAREAMSEAAELLENLSNVYSRSETEKGWRVFWEAFSRHLDLGHTQRTYSWHDLMDACNAGIRAAAIFHDGND